MRDETVLTVTISSANDAMVREPAAECVSLLKEIAALLTTGDLDQRSGRLLDSNGNTVGTFFYSPAELQDAS